MFPYKDLLLAILDAVCEENWDQCRKLAQEFFEKMPLSSERLFLEEVPDEYKLTMANYWFDVLDRTGLIKEAAEGSLIQRVYNKICNYLQNSEEFKNQIREFLLYCQAHPEEYKDGIIIS